MSRSATGTGPGGERHTLRGGAPGPGWPLAVTAVAVASAVVGLNTTAVGTSTRGMAGELGLGIDELAVVVGVYLTVAAALAVVGGRLADDLGRKRTFLAGVCVFALGSATVAVSSATGWIVTGRAVQGIGAALLLPTSITLLLAYAPPNARHGPRVALRVRAVAFAAAFGMGPLLGGVLTDRVSWRALYWGEAALMVLAAVAMLVVLTERSAVPKAPTRDLRGAVLVSVAVWAVVTAAWRTGAWGPGPTVALVLLAVVAVGLLVVVESRSSAPIVDWSLIRRREVLGANLATLAASIGMIGLVYFFDLFARAATQFEAGPVRVAVLLLPFTGAIVVSVVLAGVLGDRVGSAAPVLVGLGLSVVGFLVLSRVGLDAPEAAVLVPLALCGIGSGMANGGAVLPAVRTDDPAQMDEAAGLVTTMRFLGAALAIVVGTNVYLATARAPDLSALADAGQDPAVVLEERDVLRESLLALREDLRAPFEATAGELSVRSFTDTMRLTGAVVAVLTAVSGWLLLARRPRRREPASTALPATAARSEGLEPPTF